MNSEGTSSGEGRFDKLISLLIASVAVLVAITAFLQNFASNRSSQANRTAQALAIESTNREVSGALQYSYDWQGAFQTWYEIDLQITAAEQSGDTAAAERYRALREKIVPLSPLLTAPYFNTDKNWSDTNKYVSDVYLIDSTRLSELFEAHAAVGRAWSDIANAFVIQLTLLTVTLSLFGLSTTLRGRVRWLFVIVGSGLVLLCVLWMGLALIQPRPEVSEQAIDAYAEGVGLAYQEKYEDAIAAFDRALAIKPDYANAIYERGFTYLTMNDYERAISDLLAARDAGREGVYTQWNLGWAYYLQGRFEEAIQANTAILDSDHTVIGMRTNQALNYLAIENLEQARQEYDAILQEVERQVVEARNNDREPSASLWYYMDAASIDLQGLIDQLDGNPKVWTEAPEPQLVRGDHAQIRAFALEQIKRLKEATLALEYTGQLPPEQEVMQVSPFAFGSITKKDEQGYVTEFEAVADAAFPQYTPSVDVQFTYSGHVPTRQIMWKVFHNGVEDASFRSVWDPDLSGSDTWYKTVGYNYTNVFVLPPGEYVVELYVDYHLVQTGTFYVLGE
ncbi:MAG TPA: tetratricopeptide repeat protein [Anaerolineales bacterium]|nr:tetratricopeptide repeat protein [Anaerolineales bacterium]